MFNGTQMTLMRQIYTDYFIYNLTIYYFVFGKWYLVNESICGHIVKSVLSVCHLNSYL